MANREVQVRSSNVILKMRFSMPTPPNYMKGKDRFSYMEERAWVANDFIDYAGRQGQYADKATSHDNQFAILPDRGTYLDYVARRGSFADKGEKGLGENGTGVWGKNGELDGEELERVKNIFKNTKGNIWHGIISPTKELGDVQLDSKEKAMEFTSACFTRFISSTHLDYDNVEWFCGWHDDSESGIKHIQFAFCEKAPHTTAKGEKAYTQKGAIRKTALADALISFEEYFSGKRNDVHIARDDIMKKFKLVGPREIKKELANELLNLARVLPKVQGRAGYRHKEYEPYRKSIDKIADKMIKEIPTLNSSYIDLMSKVAEREERFKATASAFSNMTPTDKISELRQDIKERIGNSIISVAKRLAQNKCEKDYQALREQKLSLMEHTRQEKLLRQRQQSERRKENKRIRRIYNMFYAEISSPNYLQEFRLYLERLKLEQEEMRVDINSTED